MDKNTKLIEKLFISRWRRATERHTSKLFYLTMYRFPAGRNPIIPDHALFYFPGNFSILLFEGATYILSKVGG